MRSTLECALLKHVRACSCAHEVHGELTDATLVFASSMYD